MCQLNAQTCNEVPIYFKSNKYNLSVQDVTQIQKTIAFLGIFTFQSVLIEGYSDSIGTEKTNAILSQKRIDATLGVLKPLLEPAVRIETLNWGESRQISKTNLNENRCVKITFVLDTLVNLAKKGEGEIWLNTKSLDYFDFCNFYVRVLPRFDHITESYSATLPLDTIPDVYVIHMPNNCREVYYFPGSFYNPLTHIGKFTRHIPLLKRYYSKTTDSLDFTVNADKIKHDSITKSYYLIQECNHPGGWPCGGPIVFCNSLSFVPEETNSHQTKLTFYDFADREMDTIFVSDSLVWNDWKCMSTKDSAYVYSIAIFDSTYHYLKGEIEQYRKGHNQFEMNDEKYNIHSAFNIYLLKRSDYISFSSHTNKRLFVKAKNGYVPGYYLKEYDTIISFEHIRGKRYKAYAIDYPIEFIIQNDTTIIEQKDLTIKQKVRKTKVWLKLKPSKAYIKQVNSDL